MGKRIALALVAAVVLLAPQTATAATTRYAAPGGSNTGGCTSTDPADPNGPCLFPRAVQQAAAGDTVDVFEGTHDLGSITVDTFGKTDLTIRGAPGQAVPRIVTAGATPVVTARQTVTVRRLTLINNGTGNGVGTFGGTIEQVYAQASSTGGAGCVMEFSAAILRDSVCRDVSGSAFSAGLVIELSSGTVNETVRNVTAVGTGPGTFGVRARAPAAGANLTVDAANVIARGGAADLRVEAGNLTSSATVNLAYSNYATTSPGGGPGAESFTPAGTGTNQTGAPLFANAAAGDFHQLAGSPTIDAGIVDSSVGTADFEGDLRQIGTAVDIGADEFVPPPPVPEPEPEAGDASPPDTTITDGPESKTKKKSATITFSGTDARAVAGFQCKLDEGSFEACTSPKTYSRLKKGRHTVEVRAVDAAGNVDPTPASRSWKVKKKRKK